jgi:hypothetical protein
LDIRDHFIQVYIGFFSLYDQRSVYTGFFSHITYRTESEIASAKLK